MIRTLNWLIVSALLSLAVVEAVAGDAGESAKKDEKFSKDYDKHSSKKHSKKHSEKSIKEMELKSEIGFFAQKLLDVSGEDTLTISQEPFTKPFLGICGDPRAGGVKLTCITPGHNAEAAGLRTGDVVYQLDDIDFTSPNARIVKKAYYDYLGKMKTGQVITFRVYRGSSKETIDVTVGKLSQPGYIMTIRRK